MGLTGCALHIIGRHVPAHGQADKGRLGGAHARDQRSLAGAPAAAALQLPLMRCFLSPQPPAWVATGWGPRSKPCMGCTGVMLNR